MACADKIAKDILNSCDEIPRAGYESIAWAINRSEIDTITWDATIPNLVESITLTSGAYAYKVTAVKKEANAGFDLVTGDDIPDTYQQYFSFKPYEHDAEAVKNFDDMEDLVIITELKGDKTEGCFVIYGLEKGLYKSAGTQRGNDNVGLPQYEFASLEGQGERYSRFILWDTDYATTKAAIEALVVTYGPELHTDANAASDPNGNEADATTGWTAATGLDDPLNTFESQAAVKNTGSYALHADADAVPTNGANFQKDFTVEDGETYQLSFLWRHIGTATAAWAALMDGVIKATITNTETTFTNVTITAVASGTTMEVRFKENGSGNDGGVYVDNLSFRKVI